MIISCRGRVSIGSPEYGVKSPVSGVRSPEESPEESPETFLRAPGSSVALPEMSGKVAGGFEGFVLGFDRIL